MATETTTIKTKIVALFNQAVAFVKAHPKTTLAIAAGVALALVIL